VRANKRGSLPLSTFGAALRRKILQKGRRKRRRRRRRRMDEQ